MVSLVQRTSLVVQTVELLRTTIAAGEWGESLPGERDLCQRIGVSRPTLRSALEILEQEGVVRTAHGKRRLAVRGSVTAPHEELPNVVGVISADHQHNSTMMHVLRISELREYLHGLGFRLETHSNSRFSGEHPQRALEQLVQSSPARCWVLNGAKRPMQQWFAERRIPTVLLGTCYPKIEMPAMSLHHIAVCRHAVGSFMRLGHRRIVLFIRDSGYAGDLESEAGFGSAVTQAGLNPTHCPIIRHDSTVRGMRFKLTEALQAKAPPTAILVAVPGHAITVASHLLSEGFGIPEDISLICRDEDHYLDYFVPRMARYRYSPINYTRRLCRMVGRVITGGQLPPRPLKIFPNLDKGQTLAQCPSESENLLSRPRRNRSTIKS